MSLLINDKKVDAQGADLAVISSGGAELRRIRHIELEAQNLGMEEKDAFALYPGAPQLPSIAQSLAGMGLGLAYCHEENCAIAEYNCVFALLGFTLADPLPHSSPFFGLSALGYTDVKICDTKFR